ncbi:hypothetical protein Curi_c19320 [Gottschalkia acidurici 9a]|uniref:Pentapeptide repeat-containing protein n=1 Tax=Gottschalkia acidurici (strain ATCC 7906 / DSM 604 / BCRC 14475 / CIP 104303 / KCTC 5404 / NCIMB 10678 / 9a) TaxID=1128398 RepID=K0B1I9_GOTA9|nr:pentapeptide repeat-containing protein [Gottschalkia acidurici]AFS78937.1 hypothetical protein Curi_c19320 [Gottschalkia acidurici 9a]
MQEKYYEGQVFKNKKIKEMQIEHYKFVDCVFEDCSFEDCKIVGCAFVNCQFYNCNVINLSSQYSEVKSATFKKCNLIGVYWSELLPAGVYAQSIDEIKDSYLKYNTFMEMSFRKFDFSGNIIQESTFEECNLMESSFQDCRLEATQISRCDIRKADFRGAMGYIIDISTNKMKDAKFSFPEVISLLDSFGIKVD